MLRARTLVVAGSMLACAPTAAPISIDEQCDHMLHLAQNELGDMPASEADATLTRGHERCKDDLAYLCDHLSKRAWAKQNECTMAAESMKAWRACTDDER